MKGISPLVSYVLAVLLAIVVIAGTTLLAYNIYDTILKDQIRRDLTQVAAQTAQKVTDLYTFAKASKSSPPNSTAVLLADSELNLPGEVADRDYRLVLVSANQVSTLVSNITLNDGNVTNQKSPQTAKIIAGTTEDPFVEIEYDLPLIDIDVQGRTGEPANATLRYYRYNPNGTVLDTVVLGDAALLVQVTVVS